MRALPPVLVVRCRPELLAVGLLGPDAALHGLGLLIVLLAGFGMLAKVMRTPSMPSPAWATTKLVIWALFAVAAVVPRRWPRTARWVLVLGLPLLGAAAAVVAILKPF